MGLNEVSKLCLLDSFLPNCLPVLFLSDICQKAYDSILCLKEIFQYAGGVKPTTVS